MTEKFDVVALGELLVDFTDNGRSPQGNVLFEANPGGAPCNVLSMLQRLGHKTAFIGKIGKDLLGEMLRTKAELAGICMDGLVVDEEVRTTLAFVQNQEDGDRSFSFYRNPGADMMLRKEEIREELLRSTRIFHFGTLSMTHETVENATKYAVHVAKESGALISFDPNLRELLWDSPERARDKMEFGMHVCDILKIADNEVEFLTGEKDVLKGARRLVCEYQVPLLLLTLGKEGSIAFYKGEEVRADAFLQKTTVDTTGAGDTFFGCVLHYVLENGLEELTNEKLEEMLRFANAAASVITTRKGALSVMPAVQEIEKVLRTE